MSTRKLESQATPALEQVTTENEKGTDQQYFQNSEMKQSERNVRSIREKKKKKVSLI